MLLHLADCQDPVAFSLAERFAIGLRLLDDLLDRIEDVRAGRRRVPVDDLRMYGVELEDLAEASPDEATQELLAMWAVRARMYLRYGQPLARRVPESLRPLVTSLCRLGLHTSQRLEAG
jgi:phytoene/squalene synthetase